MYGVLFCVSIRTLFYICEMLSVKRYSLIMFAVLTMLIGCVAYPIQRTYFAPDYGEGTPVATSGCGYHTTKKDALERTVGGVTITVMPEYIDGENLKLTLLLQSEGDYTSLSPEAVSVSGAGIENALYAVDIATTMLMPGKNEPYYRQWHSLSYPVLVNDISDLTVTIPTSAIGLPKSEYKTITFGFSKTEKADFYYNSINC